MRNASRRAWMAGALSRAVVTVWMIGATLFMTFAVSQKAHAGIGMKAPEILNETWLNGNQTSFAALKGKVVMVEFWTFGCYNCRNVEPHVRDWHRKYKDRGFVVIGVHSPEFSYERDVEKVKKYLRDHEIDYAVPIDNEFATWNRYGNRYWPAMYLIDKKGVIRSVRIGEGGYQETEKLIQSLLAEPS